jgi:hypothetical protein
VEANSMTIQREDQNIEEQFAHLLNEGDLVANSPEEEAVNQLIPPYESRIKVEKDPIKEETKIIQRYAAETNDKYLKYIRD